MYVDYFVFLFESIIYNIYYASNPSTKAMVTVTRYGDFLLMMLSPQTHNEVRRWTKIGSSHYFAAPAHTKNIFSRYFLN